MRNLTTYKIFSLINEDFSLSDLKSIKGISKTLIDPFTSKLIPDIIKLANSKISDEKTWITAYKNIFRKICVKFGSANKMNVSKTCRKDQALRRALEYYFDPERGKIPSKQIKEWVDFTTKGRDPKQVRYETTPIQIDQAVMKIVEILKRTGMTPIAIRDCGTYMLKIAIPVMKKFYPVNSLKNLKMFRNNVLMDAGEINKLLVEPGVETQEPTKPGQRIEF